MAEGGTHVCEAKDGNVLPVQIIPQDSSTMGKDSTYSTSVRSKSSGWGENKTKTDVRGTVCMQSVSLRYP